MFIFNKLLCKRKREEEETKVKKQRRVFKLPLYQRKILNSIHADFSHIKVENYLQDLPLSIWYLFQLRFPTEWRCLN